MLVPICKSCKGGKGIGIRENNYIHSCCLLYTSEKEPEDTESSSGQFNGVDQNADDIIIPKFEQNSSGGGSEELAPVSYTHLDVYKRQAQKSVETVQRLYGT